MTMHYSFDFPQQIHIPRNPMQPGLIYFKTPRKCGIFGVMCEAVPKQVNYLIDEASDVGKGANTTISYIHHFFQNHGLGETHVHLHADNCSGQNKNNYFIWYNFSVEDNFAAARINQLFLPYCGSYKVWSGSCFGMIKKAYKVNFVSSLYEFADMVDASSTNGVNKAQLVSTHDGRIIVSAYN